MRGPKSKDQRSTEQLIEAWGKLSRSSKREVVRKMRENGRELGDWRGPDDIDDAYYLATNILEDLGA